MAGILTLTVLNSKKFKETIDTAFSSEDKLITKLVEDEAHLTESLTSDKDSQILLALKAVLKVPFFSIFCGSPSIHYGSDNRCRKKGKTLHHICHT